VTLSSDIVGLIVVLDEAVMPGLARFAMRHGWSVVKLPEIGQTGRLVLRRRAQAIVVQVSLKLDETIALIQLLKQGSRPMPIVAVAGVHNEQIERAIRGAGANCYLPGTSDADMIAQAVAAVLPNHDEPDKMENTDIADIREIVEYPRLLRGQAG
jgi:DNA-binding NarL/FixJ family response regulator